MCSRIVLLIMKWCKSSAVCEKTSSAIFVKLCFCIFPRSAWFYMMFVQNKMWNLFFKLLTGAFWTRLDAVRLEVIC